MTDLNADLGLEPQSLDGHTIEELDDYLARGRRPADASIDNSPACQIALGALQRLRQAAGDLLARRSGDERGDVDWIAGVIAALPLESHAGRRFLLPSVNPQLIGTITEGAIRGLVRAVGDDIPGLLVGSVRLSIQDPPPTGVIEIDIAVVYGIPISEASRRLREALTETLPKHMPFAIERIDIQVTDVFQLRGSEA